MPTCLSSNLEKMFSTPVYVTPCCYTLFTFIMANLMYVNFKGWPLYHMCLSATNLKMNWLKVYNFLKDSILLSYHNK